MQGFGKSGRIAGRRPQFRKDGLHFYKECAACRRSEPFYVNASLADLNDPAGVGSS